MEHNRIPKPGEIYQHFKDKIYQIITVATHTETGEAMVVYQALYGDFRTYVRPLTMFLSKVDKDKYPEVVQQYRFEHIKTQEGELIQNNILNRVNNEEQYEPSTPEVSEAKDKVNNPETSEIKYKVNNSKTSDVKYEVSTSEVSEAKYQGSGEIEEASIKSLLLKFLDAETYSKKLELVASSRKHLSDRLITDMAVSLDITVDEGPLEERIERLLYSLQTMSRFEYRRLR